MKGEKKILIVTEDLSFDGGPTTEVIQLVKELVGRNYQVTLVYSCSQKLSSRVKEILNSVKTLEYRMEVGKFRGQWMIECWNLAKKLKTLEAMNSYDLVYLWLYLPPLAVFTMDLFSGVPNLLYFSGAMYLDYKFTLLGGNGGHKKILSVKNKIDLFVQKQLQKYCLERADLVETCSNYAKSILVEQFNIDEDKIVIRHPGVNCNLFYPLNIASRKKLRKKLGFNVDTNLLLMVSRLEKRKGIDIAIMALAKVLNKFPNTILLIIFPSIDVPYSSPLTEYLKIIAANNIGGKVLFASGLTNNSLPPYYQIADCFLMPSRDLETFGITTIESLACGTPVLGTPGPAIKEILEGVGKELVMNGFQAEDVAEKICWYLALPRIVRMQLSDKSVKLARSRYSWGNIMSTLREVNNRLKR